MLHKILVVVLMLAVWIPTARSEEAPAKRSGWSFRDIGLVPVQSGGRIKPLDSLARELTLYETGSKSFQGWEPVDLLLSWISNPSAWQEVAFVQINHKDVKRQLGLDESRSRFSPSELFKNPTVAQYAERMGQTVEPPDPKGGMRMNPREQELKRVYDRLGIYHTIVSGHAWVVIPKSGSEAWESLATTTAEGAAIRKAFVDVLTSYNKGDQEGFQKASIEARKLVESKISNWNSSLERVLSAESFYNRFKPFHWAWILYVAGCLVWLFALGSNAKKGVRYSALILTYLGLASEVFGILIRCYIAGRPPVTNMYESVIWVSFGVMFFASILFYLQRQGLILAIATAVSSFCLIAADAAPAILDPSINPLVPVLRSNYWLTIHVMTITLGYAAFALTLGLGNVSLFHHLRLRPGWMAKVNNLNQLTYRSMQFGVVLLAAGTILGGVWADYSWGRFWGWDPKEVWALIALLCYLAILHARYAGYLTQLGYAAWTVISFLSVLMAWYGVNFVLGVGLHSYGFSTGGRGWVAGFCGLQLLYVGVVYALARMRKIQTA